MASEDTNPTRDAAQNALSLAFVGMFVVVLSAPYFVLACFGPRWSLAALLPTYALGALTGYGWTFKRGSETLWYGVAPVFGLLLPVWLAALLLDLSLIIFRHPNAPFPPAAPNLFLLVLSGLLILWTTYSLIAFLLHLWRMFR